MGIFRGSAVALITPFTDVGVNFKVYEELLDFQMKKGTDAIVALGTTGEPSTMTEEEKTAVLKLAIEKVNKRVPLIAGTGGNNTAKVIADSKRAEALGADALLVVTPYYNKCSPRGLIAHFYAVADSVSIPIIVYNVPSRTGVNVTPAQLVELGKHPRIRGMKEASGNIAQITEMARLCGHHMDLYSGDDGITLPLLALGFQGVISVAANVVPHEIHRLVASYFEGDLAASRQWQFKLNPLIEALFLEVNPIPVKTAMGLLGFDVGPLRLPLTDMASPALEKLKEAMTGFGLKLP